VTSWVSTLPTWASFFALVFVWNVLALLAMFFCRRWSVKRGVSAGPAVVNSWATCVGGLTALLFAFTVVTLWNQLIRAEQNVDDEASALRAVARDVLPSQLELVRNYAQLTVDEWPLLCGGHERADVEASLVLLNRVAQPRSDRYSDNLFAALGTLEDLRNRRWQVSTSAVPDEVWVALAVLSCTLLVVLGIAMPDHGATHLVLMVAVGTALGTLFWVTVVLEYPFCGPSGIFPVDIMTVLRTHLV
jgi:Protein of unknown function (DUF4239)